MNKNEAREAGYKFLNSYLDAKAELELMERYPQEAQNIKRARRKAEKRLHEVADAIQDIDNDRARIYLERKYLYGQTIEQICDEEYITKNAYYYYAKRYAEEIGGKLVLNCT